MKKYFVRFILLSLLITTVGHSKGMLVEAKTSTKQTAVGEKIKDVFPDQVFQKAIIDILSEGGEQLSPESILTSAHLGTRKLHFIGSIKEGKDDEAKVIRNELHEIKSVEGIQYFSDMTQLKIFDTKIEKFPMQIFENKKLKYIDISYNYMMDMSFEDRFDEFVQLERLNLEFSGSLTSNPFVFPESLYSHSNLQRIRLTNTGAYNTGLKDIPNPHLGGAFFYYRGDLTKLPSNTMEAKTKELNFGFNKITELSLEEYDFFTIWDSEDTKRISNQSVEEHVNYDVFKSKELVAEGTVFKTIHEVIQRDDVQVNVYLAGYGSRVDIDYYDVYDIETGNIFVPKVLEFETAETAFGQVSLYIDIPVDKDDGSENGELRGSTYKYSLNSDPITRNVVYKDVKTGEVLDQDAFTKRPGESLSHVLPVFEKYTLVEDQEVIDVTFETNKDIVVFYEKDSTITINYVDENGNKLQESNEISGKPGSSLPLDVPLIDGYVVSSEFVDYVIVFKDGDYTINVIFNKVVEELPVEEVPNDAEDKPSIPSGSEGSPTLPNTGVSSNYPMMVIMMLLGFGLLMISKKKRLFKM